MGNMNFGDIDPAALTVIYTAAGVTLVVSVLGLLLQELRRRRKKSTLERDEDERLENLLRERLPPNDWSGVWAKLSAAVTAADRRAVLAKAYETHGRAFGLHRPQTVAPNLPTTPETGPAPAPGTEWEARLVAIETRLPSAQVVEYIASVNEVRMATHIEHLQKAIDEIKSSMPSKADVAGSTLTTLAAIAGIVAVVTWVLTTITSG